MPSGCLIALLSPWHEHLAPTPQLGTEPGAAGWACRPTALQGTLWSLSCFMAGPEEWGAFVSRQKALARAHRAQALLISVPAICEVASFPVRAQN